MDNRKKGFTNQTYGQQRSQSSYQYQGNDQAAFQDVAAYIQAGRYQDALSILEQIRTRSSLWFYYSALAMNGIGNNATALEYAQTAAQMEPGNLQYLFLFNNYRQEVDNIARHSRLILHLMRIWRIVVIPCYFLIFL